MTRGNCSKAAERGRRSWNPAQCLLGFLSLSGCIPSLLQTREGLAEWITGQDVWLNAPECSLPSAQPGRLPGVVTGQQDKATRVRWSLRSAIWPPRTSSSLQTYPVPPRVTSKALGWLLGFSCQRRKQGKLESSNYSRNPTALWLVSNTKTGGRGISLW